MALTCGFFDSQNGDRKYSAEQMSAIFDGLITDGVYDGIGEIMAVTPNSGMTVNVGTGRAWFNHTWSMNDAKVVLTISAADVSLKRIDAVVLEVNSSNTTRANSFKVVKGTPASSPSKPTMTDTDEVHQHALAYITVAAGATSITSADIEVVVGKSETPFVTSVVQSTSIDALFQQWEGQFDDWFSHLQIELSGDVAANLQRQIDENTSDIAVLESKDGHTVGDIVTTARTDLGEKYLLANGSTFSPTDYPKLAEILPMTANYKSIGTSYHIVDYGFYNGMHVAVGETPSTSHKIYATVDLKSTWTSYTVTTTDSMCFRSIAYHDGTWVILGSTYSYASSSPTYVLTATSLSGPWTVSTLHTRSVVSKVRYYDSYWVICGGSDDVYPTVWYTKAPTGTWTKKVINSSTSRYLTGIYYDAGQWVALTWNWEMFVYTATSLTGTWTQYKVDPPDDLSGASTFDTGTDIVHIGNDWIISGRIYDDEGRSSNIGGYIWVATSPAGPWTSFRLTEDNYAYIYFTRIHDGKWIFGSNGKYYVSDNISGPFVLAGTSINELIFPVEDDSLTFIGGTYATYYANMLPIVYSWKASTTKESMVYNYIKVKE